MASNGAEDFKAQAFGPGLAARARSATARMSTSSDLSNGQTRTVSYTQSPPDHAVQLRLKIPQNQQYYSSGTPVHRACLALSPASPKVARGKEAFTANASGNGLSHGVRVSSVAPSATAGSSASFTASQSSLRLGASKNSCQSPGRVKSLQLRPGLLGRRSLSSQRATSRRSTAVVENSVPDDRSLPWSGNKVRISSCSSRATPQSATQDLHSSGDKEFRKPRGMVRAGSGRADHLLKCRVSYEGTKGLGTARGEIMRVPFTVAIERLIESGSLLRNGTANGRLTRPPGCGSDPPCVVEAASTGSAKNPWSSGPAPPCLANGDEQSRCVPDYACTAPGVAARRHSLTAASASATVISGDVDGKGACLKQASIYSVTSQLSATHLTNEDSPLLQQGELGYPLPPLEDHRAMGLRVLNEEAVSMSLDEVEEEELPDEMEGHCSGDDNDGCDCSSMINSSSARFMEDSSSIEDPSTPVLEEGVVLKPALVPSLFPLTPPTLYFATAKERVELLPEEQRKFLKWKMSSVTPHVVKHTVARSHFRVTKRSHDWLGCWGHHMKSAGFRTLREYQKLNHFPGSFQIGRKDRLWRNLSKMQVHFGKQEFGFFPRSFVLPQDIKLLRKAWDSTGTRQKWIVKPPASARGIGIQVIHKWSQLPNRRPLLVQKYLHKPYLISGNKFDLRIYVYVTSYDPLRVYIFTDGLVRFASCKYSSSLKSLSNKFMHLTNYSVNKKNSEYQSNSDDKACQGHKWALKALWQYLGARGINTILIWEKIKDIVVKTIIASDPYVNTLVKMHVRSPYCCHELFGFDIMLDEHLRPWLLEVNISPSLHSNSALDANIKGQMMRDLMNLAGFVLPQRDELGPLKSSSASSSASSLGGGDKEKSRHSGEILFDEKIKRAHFLSQNQRSTNPAFYSTVLDALTPRDVRVLTEAEDELSRRGEFERVFPSPTSSRYLRFFEQPRYLNILLNQWEQKHWNNRSKGINLLRSLCQKGFHLGNASYLPHPWSVLSISSQKVESWSNLSIKEEPIRSSVVVSQMHSAQQDEEGLPSAVSSPPDTGASTPTGFCSLSCESLHTRDFI